ncbi:transmembrane protein 87A [Senna tora]|uniref:Transmembrane protein 87A n=1 Tax=Senna tora TaxID=362788 RepID=A0A834WCE4_9FABA|nr:transmembrane protein 87A [Senna tora]
MSRFCESLSILVLLSVLFLCSEASVHDYRGEKFVGKGNAFVVHGGSEGIYSSISNQNDSSVAANGDSYIRFERVRFHRTKEYTNFSSWPIQAVVFEVEDRETIGGSAYGGQRAVCCTGDLAKLGACTEGQVIYRPSTTNSDWPQVFGISFNTDDEEASLPSRSIRITKTGMYNLYFIHCDPRLKEVVVEGKTIWKNPSGYLPGRMAPLKNFYGFMSLAFVLLGIFWFSQYARFWREVIPLQNCITIVITLGMLEMTLWYFDYAEFNETGVRPTGTTIWAVTFGTVKRTVARLIILMVSMGYGVVRPTLGGLTSKVVMLGSTFFLASEVLELIENVGAISDLSGKARLFLVLPVAVLDAFFILWIFTSLSATLNKLQAFLEKLISLYACLLVVIFDIMLHHARRMMIKLDMYRKFTNALAVAVIVSVGWICYELYFKSNDVYNEQWQNAWIIPAFWQVLSFSLLCVICALWAPSQNSLRCNFISLLPVASVPNRYSYSDDGSDEFDKDDTSLTLIKPSPISSKDVLGMPDARPVQGSNGVSNGDLEEDKTE